MTWDGRPAGPKYAAGNTVASTNASGIATISFGVTFAAPPVVTAMGGNGESVTLPGTAVTTTAFTAAFYTQAGSVIANGAVRCHWQALPAT